MIRHLVTYVGFLICIFPFGASAGLSLHDLLLIVSTEDDRNFDVFKGAIEAQLSDFETDVRVVDTAGKSIQTGALDHTRTLMKEKHAAVAVVLSGASMSILFQDDTTEEVVEREFPNANRFEDACDVAASVIRSDMEHWLITDHVPDLEAQSEDIEKEMTPSESNAAVGHDLPPPVPNASSIAVSAVIPTPAHRTFLGLGVDAAYTLQIIDTVDAVLNGMYAGLRFEISRFFAFSAGADVLQRSRFDHLAWSFDYRRVPMRLTLMGMWSIKRLTLGLYTGVVIDFTRMRATWEALDDRSAPSPDDIRRLPPPFGIESDHDFKALEFEARGAKRFVGFSSGATADLSLFKWMSLYVTGGTDVFFGAEDYTFTNGELVYAYEKIQPRVSAGFKFWFFKR